MSRFLIFTAKIIQKKFPEFLCAFKEKKCVKLCGYAMFEVGSSSSKSPISVAARAEVCMTIYSLNRIIKQTISSFPLIRSHAQVSFNFLQPQKIFRVCQRNAKIWESGQRQAFPHDFSSYGSNINIISCMNSITTMKSKLSVNLLAISGEINIVSRSAWCGGKSNDYKRTLI